MNSSQQLAFLKVGVLAKLVREFFIGTVYNWIENNYDLRACRNKQLEGVDDFCIGLIFCKLCYLFLVFFRFEIRRLFVKIIIKKRVKFKIESMASDEVAIKFDFKGQNL